MKTSANYKGYTITKQEGVFIAIKGKSRIVKKSPEDVVATIDTIDKYDTVREKIVKEMDFLDNLFIRWQDEKQYEDINDYKTVIAKRLDFDEKNLKMTKSPFGFKYTIDRTILTLKITLSGYKIMGEWKKK
jgi:5'-deoxynucleotidase YfbR-like HD superfamily hydrolase